MLSSLTPTFDAATHRYTVGTKELISVTQAIKIAGLMDDRFFTEDAALRGTYVHQALEYLDRGELVEDSVDPQLAGYVTAYRAFLHDCHAGPLHLYELPLCDPIRGYAGTIDRVRHVGQQLSVVDLKTGPPAPWHGVQLAAYAELVKAALNVPLLRRWGCYLHADGTYTCHAYTDRSDWDTFCACLTLATWKRRHA